MRPENSGAAVLGTETVALELAGVVSIARAARPEVTSMPPMAKSETIRVFIYTIRRPKVVRYSGCLYGCRISPNRPFFKGKRCFTSTKTFSGNDPLGDSPAVAASKMRMNFQPQTENHKSKPDGGQPKVNLLQYGGEYFTINSHAECGFESRPNALFLSKKTKLIKAQRTPIPAKL